MFSKFVKEWFQDDEPDEEEKIEPVEEQLPPPSKQSNNVKTRKSGKKSARKELQLKIVLVGGAKVGKTAILNRYTYDTYHDDEFNNSTVGVDILSYALNNYPLSPNSPPQKLILQFWDVGHQEQTGYQHDIILSQAHGIIYVCDGTPESMNSVDIWRSLVSNFMTASTQIPMILLVNKSDIQSRLLTSRHKAVFSKYCQGAGMFHWECVSALNGDKVADTMEMFIDKMISLRIGKLIENDNNNSQFVASTTVMVSSRTNPVFTQSLTDIPFRKIMQSTEIQIEKHVEKSFNELEKMINKDNIELIELLNKCKNEIELLISSNKDNDMILWRLSNIEDVITRYST